MLKLLNVPDFSAIAATKEMLQCVLREVVRRKPWPSVMKKGQQDISPCDNVICATSILQGVSRSKKWKTLSIHRDIRRDVAAYIANTDETRDAHIHGTNAMLVVLISRTNNDQIRMVHSPGVTGTR